MNRLLATTAMVLLLGAAPAFAEPAADQNAASPAMKAPAPSDTPSMQTPSSTPTADTLPGKSSEMEKPLPPKADLDKSQAQATAKFLTKQTSDEWLASNIIDKSVVNASNQSIGDVNDLVTDANGRIVAAVIGVGGFLGIGEKDVAVPFQDLKLSRDENNNVVVTANMSRDDLTNAPDYQTLDEQGSQSSASNNLDNSRTAE